LRTRVGPQHHTGALASRHPVLPASTDSKCYYARVRAEKLFDETLAQLSSSDLLREPDDGATRDDVGRAASALGLPVLDASSNDYLGLGENCVSRETLSRSGACASRLIYGTRSEHLALEAAVSTWTDTEAALTFPSTYSANIGVVSAIGVEQSLIISDAANHASLIDGARLAKARVEVVPHLDLEAVRNALRTARAAKAIWVVTESYFSMDGDGPDLPALRQLCDEHDAFLLVDEAHALGVFGPRGAGLCAQGRVRPNALVGALGKAVGSHGGFVAGSPALRRYLWNRARSFVYSTALSPAHAAAAREQVERALAADAARARLADNANRLRRSLKELGLDLIPGSFGPIVSVRLGANGRALTAAARLRSIGILAQAIRPPTVPLGSARLRFTVKSTFSDADMQRLISAIGEACCA